jgi:uncharacterized membrane protein YdbT with pleckstrin-like domain
MKNIDYFKEKLNTLRVEFMAKVFIMIAIGSGLSKIILSTNNLMNNTEKTMFNLGFIILIIFIIYAIYDIVNLRIFNKKLKDK